MKIGVMLGLDPRRSSLEHLTQQVVDLDRRGFASAWIPQVFGLDAVTTAALLGRETQRIELGTAVVPTYPRHPAALAQQALTAGSACAGRFTLGIGLSHPIVIEGVMGLSYARRAAHMREYMEVLGPLLRKEPAKFEGEEFRVNLALEVPEAPRVPVLIAALGEQMLEIAGRTAAGTILWMTGPRTIETHIAPKLRAAANRAQRPAPRIVAGLQIALTTEPDAMVERLAKRMAIYGQLPSYRAMLDKEGTTRPTDLAILGDENALDKALGRLRDVGVTDFEAAIIPDEHGSGELTLQYLEKHL